MVSLHKSPGSLGLRWPQEPPQTQKKSKPPNPENPNPQSKTLRGGSWVAIRGVLRRVIRVMTQIRGLITPLITTHEPPSRALNPKP